MLGANVGTTLIVQVLSFNISGAAAPVLFIIGLVAFRSGARSRIKDVGRVFIGLGLMLLALHILLNSLAPAENAPGVRVFMNAITGDPVLCIIIGAAGDVGCPIQRGHRASDHARWRIRSSSRRMPRWPWCSAPISAARSIRYLKERNAIIRPATGCPLATCSIGSWG